MSWLNTLRQFLTLLFIVTIVLCLIFVLLTFVGTQQVYTRIDHPVLNKINNSIYLNSYPCEDCFLVIENKFLPIEIQHMKYLQIHNLDSKLTDISEPCLFLDFVDSGLESGVDATGVEKFIQSFSEKDCVFLNTQNLRLKSYLSRLKPRWFYSYTEVDFQKSIFMDSIGLVGLAPLKGDFIIFEENNKISKSLMSEIARRKMIILLRKSNKS